MTAAVEEFRGPVVPPPGEWIQEALCTQTDLEVFHPPKGASGKEAKQVCARCPVQRQCLRWAVETGQRDGILGGTSPKERRVLTVELVDAMPPATVAEVRIPLRVLPVGPKVRPKPIPEPRPVPEVPEPPPAGFEVFTKKRKVAQCGTLAGYSRHKRLKEPSCDACKAATAEYQRAYMARKKQQARVPGSSPRPTPPAPRPTTVAKPVVRVMWLLPPATTGSRPEYATVDGSGRFELIHPATAAELVQQGETVHCRYVTHWAPIGGPS